MVRTDEIAPGIYRLSTFVPTVNAPEGFTFNQFLVLGEEPLLFHLGHRRMFPDIAAAVRRIVPLDKLRWLSFSHVEADECGALGPWIDAAPNAVAAHTAVGCRIWVADAIEHAPRVLKDGERLDIGGHVLQHLSTPHLPHGWDAGLLYDETTKTLLCSDLFGHGGDGPALVESDLLERAIAAEARSGSMSVGRTTPPMLRRLAALGATRLALMHGSSFAGDAAPLLRGLADHAERSLGEAS
jgi:flavorubredoxin